MRAAPCDATLVGCCAVFCALYANIIELYNAVFHFSAKADPDRAIHAGRVAVALDIATCPQAWNERVIIDVACILSELIRSMRVRSA